MRTTPRAHDRRFCELLQKFLNLQACALCAACGRAGLAHAESPDDVGRWEEVDRELERWFTSGEPLSRLLECIAAPSAPRAGSDPWCDDEFEELLNFEL